MAARMTEPGSTFVTRSPAPIAQVAPADASVDVSFVFVTFGTGPVIVEAIEQLTRSTVDVSYEVIVVDNPHPDVERRSRNELALSTAGVRVLVARRNLGFAGGCELGALHARGRVLAFVNPDLFVRPGWIEPLLARLEAGASIVAPVLLDPDGSIQEAGARVHSDGSTSPILDRSSDNGGSSERPDYASAACWLVEREEHERLGGFDAAFYPAFYEDVDLALRAVELGGRVEVVHEVAVEHQRGRGSHSNGAVFDTSAQRDLLLAKHPAIRWTRPPVDRSARW